MRVFVTGATGFIGSAIVRELVDAGHQVLGLSRSQASARALQEAGAQAHPGSLEDPDSLQSGAAVSDGVIHTAFIHDFSNFKENCEIDRRAIKALGSALAGSQRRLIVTSGTALLASGEVATEHDMPPSGPGAVPRVASEKAAAIEAGKGVNVSVVRLPPSVHGDGDHGFIPALIGVARQTGVSAFIEEGSNCWPAVHRLDAAHLYRLALETGSLEARYHGVAEEGVPFREIAGVIARRLNVPMASLTRQQAAGHFGWFAHFAGIDNRASSARTRDVLEWQPQQAGLIADIDRADYF